MIKSKNTEDIIRIANSVRHCYALKPQINFKKEPYRYIIIAVNNMSLLTFLQHCNQQQISVFKCTWTKDHSLSYENNHINLKN